MLATLSAVLTQQPLAFGSVKYFLPTAIYEFSKLTSQYDFYGDNAYSSNYSVCCCAG